MAGLSSPEVPKRSNTARIYENIQAEFQRWCKQRRIDWKTAVPYSAIGKYLEYTMIKRGASTVPVRVSAIAKMYRDTNMGFDTKIPVIQNVVTQSREFMRRKKTDETPSC